MIGRTEYQNRLLYMLKKHEQLEPGSSALEFVTGVLSDVPMFNEDGFSNYEALRELENALRDHLSNRLKSEFMRHPTNPGKDIPKEEWREVIKKLAKEIE